MKMDLSILICTHCSAKRLPETLNHLKRQKNTESILWEVIIVDYISSDGTINIAREIWSDFGVPLIIISETEAGKTPALETGLKNARGAAICIVDDDNWVNEDYVKVAYNIMNDHPEIGVIGAFGEAHCEIEPPEWFEDNKGVYAVGGQGVNPGFVENNDRLWFWGAGCVIRRDAWLKAKARGFVPRLNPTRGEESNKFKKGFTGGEDPELCFAIQLVGYRLWYEPKLKYKHYIPKGRLTSDFLANAVQGVSAAGPILRLYLAEVTPPSFLGLIRKLLYKNWILHMLYLWLKYPYLIIKAYFLNSRETPLSIAQIKNSYSSQIQALFDLRKSFGNIVRSIENLR